MKTYKPISGNILIKPIQELSGIIVPDSEIRTPIRGKIISVGEKTEILKGNIILFDKWVAKEMKLDGDTYYVSSERNILLIEEEE